MREWLKTCVAAFACAGATLPQTGTCAIDGIFIAPPEAQTAPGYESDYVADMRKRGAGDNTPESDARIGEQYFRRAVEAYRKADFKFAIEMYEVAASWAYKPAEYNLGVMYARGQGAPVDLPRAMAWMALAAERNDKHYVDARETVYASLTKEQFEQANEIWRELKKTYGDEVALRRAKARWADVKSHMTGSRVGTPGPLTVGVPNPGSGVTQGPKIVVAGGATGKSVNNAHSEGSHAGPTTAGEMLGGSGVDGSIVYRQFQQSDNPYDPKFDRGALGTATVGPVTEIKDGEAPKSTPAEPESPKQDH
jgi:hypothetical protein